MSKELNRKIKDLKREAEGLRIQLNEARADRDIYRSYCVSNYKWFVSLLSECKTPCLKYLIKEHARAFNKAERFYMDFGQ